jgi:hypothetical protein
MKLIKMIPLDQIKVSLDSFMADLQFTFVISQGYLKIYKQVKV